MLATQSWTVDVFIMNIKTCLTSILRGNIWCAAGYLLGIAGIVLAIATVSGVVGPAGEKNAAVKPQFSITDNVTAKDIKFNRAYIEFATAEPESVDIIAYDRHGVIAGTWSENMTYNRHRILIDNLNEATTYYFQVLYNDRRGGKDISRQYTFTTMEKPPVIINPYIKDITNNTVTLVWETERPTTAEVDYWLKGSDRFQSVPLLEKGINHAVKLVDLKENGAYMFKIRSKDAFGHMLETEYEGSFSLETKADVTWRAPYFELTSFDGETISINQYNGKIVFIAFWDMYCPACQMKMPMLQQVSDKLGSKDIVFLSIHGPTKETALKNYLISEGLRLPVLYDAERKVNIAYNVRGVPAYFLLDRSGVVVSNNLQFNSAVELEKVLQNYLR